MIAFALVEESVATTNQNTSNVSIATANEIAGRESSTDDNLLK